MAAQLYRWLRAGFLLAVVGLLLWWLFRNREVLLAMAASLLAALRQFWANLFQWYSPAAGGPAPTATPARPKTPRFNTFQNPFLTGKHAAWPPSQLVFYSYEALQAWAGEHGVEPRPDQTARELCAELGERFPEMTAELSRLSALYGQAAYGASLPAEVDLQPVERMWGYMET